MDATMRWSDERGFWIVKDKHGGIWDVIANGTLTARRAAAACQNAASECRIFMASQGANGALGPVIHEGSSTTFSGDDDEKYEVRGGGWKAIKAKAK
jgi:hypothetical protein